MKAKQTRTALKIMMLATDMPIPDFESKKVDEELEELERLAKLGKATEKAYELEGVEFIEFNNFDGGTVKFFHGTDDLLEWAEGRSND